MSAIELRSTFLANATRQRGPSRHCPDRSSGALVLRDCSDRRVHRPLRAIMGLVEAKTMTVTNVLEVVVVLGVLYVAYRFFQKRG
jgi:hypothetical protein